MNIRTTFRHALAALILASATCSAATAVQDSAASPAPDGPVPEGSVPEGSTERISDWALAGVIWSDASLTEKLATEAAKHSDSPERIAALEQLADEASRLITALEAFGWKQISETPRTPDGRGVADPAVDGVAADAPAARPVARPVPVAPTAPAAPVTRPVPVDPAAPVESTEAPREDTVIEALALQASDRGYGHYRDGADGISLREVYTRSDTMPYSRASIYDRDALDAGIDSPASVVADVPAVDLGEEPFPVAAAEAEPVPASRMRLSMTDIDRYTAARADHSRDASWVRFHLDANQTIWRELTTPDNLLRRTNDSVTQLKAHALAALRSSDNEQLVEILRAVLRE